MCTSLSNGFVLITASKGMKRVLIVVSTWKPCMMADMQRARLIAGEFAGFGWEVEILSPDASFQTDFSRVQGAGMPFPDVPVHESRQWQPEVFKRLGSRNVGIRAAVPVRRKGLALLRAGRFDLVYFSTTQHWLTCQGAYWRRLTGVPYVADLHDPVYSEKKVGFVSRHRAKERIARRLGKNIERWALGRADGLVSVSLGYADDVARRNPAARWLRTGAQLVQPFPADIAALDSFSPPSPCASSRRVVYIGAGGSIMEKGWRELLACLSEVPVEGLPKFDILGTDTNWRKNQRRDLEEMAKQAGLAGVVAENPERIPYLDSVSVTLGANGLLVLGVDDPNYRPSKLQTCLATGLPLLVVLNVDSGLAPTLEQSGPGVHVVKFGSRKASRETNKNAVAVFVEDVAKGRKWDRRERSFLTPDAAARGHAALFEQLLEAARR